MIKRIKKYLEVKNNKNAAFAKILDWLIKNNKNAAFAKNKAI